MNHYRRVPFSMRALLFALISILSPLATAASPPNVVIILCDNLGNGDIACFHPATKHRTPHLDRMAAEGRKFTSFYSASGVCTPSRAALMTGCYPRRVGLQISAVGASVLQPVAQKGLHPDEETLAELLKAKSYATACIGKWHLGDQLEFLPSRQGFDHYFGIPYSEDMVHDKFPDKNWPPLPLMRGDQVIEAPVDMDGMTRRLTEEAVSFIKHNKERPFFLYFPEASPGSRSVSYPGPEFRGKSANGLYGDAIEELDWSAGQILSTLKEQGLDENTLVIWTSDNGAVRRTPTQGSNAPYQGMGYSTSEGGMRMPCIARWPGQIPAGTTSDELCTMMDLCPTVASLAGAAQPVKAIDGHDIRPLLLGEAGAKSPYAERGFYFYHIHQLQAIRRGPWKLYLPLAQKQAPGKKAGAVQKQVLQLFNVQTDVTESEELSAKHPDLVQLLLAQAEKAREVIGDGDSTGTGQRVHGWVETPTPRVKE